MSGGSSTIGFWHCDSCGAQWVTDGGSKFAGVPRPKMVTKYDPKGEDKDIKEGPATFEISHQISAGSRTMYPFDGTFRMKYPYVPKDTKLLNEPSKLLAAGD